MSYVDAGAVISKDGRYRYMLWREWRGTHHHFNWHWTDVLDGTGKKWGWPKACVFVMLNPSTADGDVDDPTIRKCVGFAKRWHYERLVVVNLFAYRATDPRHLLAMNHEDDVVGVSNQEYVARAICDAGRIICAWGTRGSYLGQDEMMLGWIYPRSTFALGLTKDGSPRHPLYITYDVAPIRYAGRLHR